jgi:hypothetical protein
MKATQSQMAFISFSFKDFEDMVKRAVMEKHPHLFTDKTWEWEDMHVANGINHMLERSEEEAIHMTFAKHEEPLKITVDSQPQVVYVRVNETCR